MSESFFLLEALDGFAKQDQPAPYWFSNDDTGYVYCLACAKKVMAGKARARLDGGFCYETDSCLHCESCGVTLDYTLTDYGANEEWLHFKGRRFRRPLDRDEAFHLARMLASNPGDRRFIQVAKRAVAKIPPESKS